MKKNKQIFPLFQLKCLKRRVRGVCHRFITFDGIFFFVQNIKKSLSMLLQPDWLWDEQHIFWCFNHINWFDVTSFNNRFIFYSCFLCLHTSTIRFLLHLYCGNERQISVIKHFSRCYCYYYHVYVRLTLDPLHTMHFIHKALGARAANTYFLCFYFCTCFGLVLSLSLSLWSTIHDDDDDDDDEQHSCPIFVRCSAL